MKKPLKSLLIFLRSLVFWCILLTSAFQVMNFVLGKPVLSFSTFAFMLLKFIPLASLLAMLSVFRFMVFSDANKPVTILILFILMGLIVCLAIPAILARVDGNSPTFSYLLAENENYSIFLSLPLILKNAGILLSDISMSFTNGFKAYLIFALPVFFAFFMYGACTFFTKWKMLNIVLLLTMFFGTFYFYSYIKSGFAAPLLQRFNLTDYTVPATFVLIAGILFLFSIILLVSRGIASLIKKKRNGSYD
ncbi:MAG: hypothetical protein CR988_07985 [Treponema sp.]|nr:MAG: hypothetical protein CR988_07985 [Treponema sp.]